MRFRRVLLSPLLAAAMLPSVLFPQAASASQYTVTFSTFIPGNNVQIPGDHCRTPSGEARDYFVQTDDRNFDPNAGTYRTRQVAVVDTQNGPALVRRENLTHETRVYAADALANGRIGPEDDDGAREDCHLLHWTGKASTRDMHVEASRPNPRTVLVHLFGKAGNPWNPSSPDIDWDFTLTLDDLAHRCSVSGDHDGFPAYEIYVNGRAAYTSWPGSPPFGPGDLARLLPPMDQHVRNLDCTSAL